ncbi:MAG: leucine-rich repeat domain-containing protein [Candidatus Thorarchaeota archaeon]|nr:MAG: hypothetical protein DRP09_06260 [Candidatus Thorarchaeota archaeon]RLI59955.1 MAG: hypothetical protein DRO87_01230 [Candidatus Thorarchaeota archaeon]
MSKIPVIIDGKKSFIDVECPIRELKLVGERIEEIDLTQLLDNADIEELDLRGNELSSIDLSPLSGCKNLRILKLKDNNLSSIDLSPLRGLKKLEWLSITGNIITSLDLTPLQDSDSLKFLYLGRNRIKHLNLYPLATLSGLQEIDIGMKDMDSDERGEYGGSLTHLESVDISPLLFCSELSYLGITYQQNVVTTSIPSPLGNTPVGMSKALRHARVEERPFEDILLGLIDHHGLKSTLTILGSNIPDQDPMTWHIHKNEIFELLGLGGLSGLDKDLSSIISDSQEGKSGSLDRHTLYHTVLRESLDQLNSDGSTLFYDPDRIDTTDADSVIFLATLLEARKREMERVVVYRFGTLFDLRLLWLTSYGYRTLKQQGHWLFTGEPGLESLKESFGVLGFEIAVVELKEDAPYPNIDPRPFSDSLKRHIFTVATLSADKEKKSETVRLVYELGIEWIMRYRGTYPFDYEDSEEE